MFHRFLNTACAVLALMMGGCSGTYKSEVHFNPAEPIRIAVLPFVQVDSSGAIVEPDPDLLIDNVALVSSKLKQTPAQFMQGLVQSELSRASLDVVPPGIVEAMLLHGLYAVPGTKPSKVDAALVLAADPAQLCPKVLPCDAVLYGQITDWSRSYYGIQSVATIGLKLKLVSARTKKVLFETEARDSDSRGITKGPTGFSNLLIEPIQGLDSKIISDLARSLASKSVGPLSGYSRAEFLSSPAPIIVAAAHSAHTGLITKGGRLEVVAYGTPGHSGSFSIGESIRGVPLVERTKGHYVGEFIPVPGDSFDSSVVSISLRDESGRVTTHTLDLRPVSYH